MSEARNKGLAAFAVATAAAVVLLIIVGGFVTTTKTGDTIPSWPLSWGRLIPPSFAGGIVVEWSHRAVAGIILLMTFALALWVQKADARSGVRKLAWAAFGGVVAQALLGGLRIFAPEMATWTSAAVAIIHACFAQAVFSTIVAVAVLLSQGWTEAKADGPAYEAHRIGRMTVIFAFLQLVAGAVTRHTGAGIAVHLIGALMVLLHASIFASKLMLTSLHKAALGLMGLLCFQVALGIGSWAIVGGGFVRSHESSWVHIATISAHVAGGALVLAVSVALTMRCLRAKPASLPLVAPQAVLV